MYIADKIIKDAESDSKKQIAQAKQDAATRLKDATTRFEQEKIAADERAKRESEQAKYRAGLVQETAKRKEELRNKQEIIDQVFATAKTKVSKTTLAEKLKKKYAKTGDKVTPVKDGGIVIENKNYTMSLSLNELLTQLRSEIELELSKRLFV